MRWLVVAGSNPLAHRPPGTAQAHPPGPGFPEQAPSVNTVVASVTPTGKQTGGYRSGKRGTWARRVQWWP